ncbi:MAG: NAD(+) diphosphatase [Verrucomicrobia bacterium]|nr:NAD(+) diphosphatase [Verrucomicrobiota bacterium]
MVQQKNSSLPGRLDRAADLRNDTDFLTSKLSCARFVPVWKGLNLFQTAAPQTPILLDAINQGQNLIFLGLDQEGNGLFAVHLRSELTEEEALAALRLNRETAQFIHLRHFTGLLNSEERALLFYSRSMGLWHENQAFCSRCGARTYQEQGGHIMACSNPSCAAQHFPRSDPATIMLVHDGDSCLLGRQPSWPEGMYSTLAGFVEVGESVEEAVAREVQEESGIIVTNIRYFGSQPWPFPQSLMLGFFAEAASRDIVLGAELEDVRWFTIAETKQLLNRLEGRFRHLDTIARRLIRHWLECTKLNDR